MRSTISIIILATIVIVNSSCNKGNNMVMVFVKGGAFQMGDTFNEGDDAERPVHTVTVNSFYMSRYEVTFSEYDAFCEATGRDKPGDEGWGRGLRPVINVTWYDAVEFCNWVSQREGLTPCYTINGRDVTCDFAVNGYRLPTEAEWEYAAREGGRNVRFGNGKDMADPEEINFNGREEYKEAYSVAGVYRGKTVAVGRFSPNSLGLYDMSCNVWEWCWDWYDGDYYKNSPRSNPKGPDSGNRRVLRGGSWGNGTDVVRCAYRFGLFPVGWYNSIGFRCVQNAF